MADSLLAFAAKMERLTDPATIRRVTTAGARAGKEAGQSAAAADLGADRRFSGMRRKASLNVGYEVAATEARLSFRPAGLWMLAESGRRNSGRIYPRRGGRKGDAAVGRRAVRTPQGPRARSSYGRSRGLGTFKDAVKLAERRVPKAAHGQLVVEIGRTMRG